MMRNKKDSDIAWILITDKLKKEWNKRDAYKEKKEEDKKIINFKEDIGFVKNPYIEAAKVKDWDELEKFMSIHAAALGPAGVAYASVKFVMDNYNQMKICYECEDAVLDLIDATKKTKGGSVAIYNQYAAQGTGPLKNFILETQYACPRIVKTFQEHMTKFKEFMGLKRNKKKVPQFREY